ncbi:deoxyribonuclease V [Kiritimatiella glycovorans]|uniref:Endonuclease V n=1 Tax=Kiritimatiella glycovorans TaxID=1307763 RepID=A0A0G3EAG2_9BACT|nr:deoxyribonuclease V [Kiritimatiella glycovorans]AKJ63431.1 Endonuclease V [Kiritimatiella glycovorans]
MDPKRHSWDLTPAGARAVQEALAPEVVTENRFGSVRHVAGVDVGFPEGRTRAAIAVLRYPDLEPVDSAQVTLDTSFPYVPGLLSFRELPAVERALEKLREKPDLILCDGQGRAHPRRMGIACHLGVRTGYATIGVAKSRLCGTFEAPGRERGCRAPLYDGRERIGTVLRTRTGVKPLFISAGHRIDLETAVDFVLRCTPRYRLPETTRAAHRLASGLQSV